MDKVNLETTKAWGKRRILAELNIKIWMVRRLPQLISTHKIALPSRIMRQRVGRFSSKRRSKHALNSIRKSCKLQNYWFKCDELRKSHKSTDSPICQTLFSPPPDEHALYKDNFASRNGKLSKVIDDIAQRDGNVFFVFHA